MASILKIIHDCMLRPNKLRQYLPVLQPLFLVGNKGGGLPEVKTQLLEEITEHKDVLQTTLEENYQRNAYKIFSGYIWIQW